MAAGGHSAVPVGQVHFKYFLGSGAACGALPGGEEMTLDPHRVTCPRCVRWLEERDSVTRANALVAGPKAPPRRAP